MKSNKEIIKLQEQIEFCDLSIEMDSSDDNSYYVKANALVKLYKITKEESVAHQAIDSFNSAIGLNPSNQLYLIDRAKFYNEIDKKELSSNDIKNVKELQTQDSNLSLIFKQYIQNTMKDLEQQNESQLIGQDNSNHEYIKCFGCYK